MELRFFGGLTIEEAAEVLDLSPATIKREWRTAKAWLYRELNRETSALGPDQALLESTLETTAFQSLDKAFDDRSTWLSRIRVDPYLTACARPDSRLSYNA